jgi:hypothetical protein
MRAREAWGDPEADVMPMTMAVGDVLVEGFGFVLSDGDGVGPMASTEVGALRAALVMGR